MARAPRILAVSFACLSAAGCGFEPGPAPTSYALTGETQAVFHSDPSALARFESQLEAAFGPPGAPRFAPIEAWAQDGIDPNRPDLPLGSGSGEIDVAETGRLRAENRRFFARQLAALESGDLDDVEVHARHAGLRAAWSSLLAEVDSGRTSDDAARARGRELFEGWYPSLSESAERYRVECLHCHGVEGGGDGPSARFLEPRPRDFRHGIFKYTALTQPARPRREDLLRTLTEGLNGTSMPSFARLPLAERHGLADIVRMLAIRGEVERRVAGTFADEGELADDAIAEETADLFERWLAAGDKVVVADSAVPAVTPQLVARGAVLFHDTTKGNCSSCHGENGAGNGVAAWKTGLDGRREAAYLDAWGRPIVPRDLRDGILRGGSRPIDVYRRIWSGIPGTPMPALGTAKGPDGQPVLSSTDVWALVHYVQSLARAAPER